MFNNLVFCSNIEPFGLTIRNAVLTVVEKSHNKKYHSGIRGIYITNTSTTMVFANEKNRFTTITVPRLLLPYSKIKNL